MRRLAEGKVQHGSSTCLDPAVRRLQFEQPGKRTAYDSPASYRAQCQVTVFLSFFPFYHTRNAYFISLGFKQSNIILMEKVRLHSLSETECSVIEIKHI
jgi:hypothetical protein